MIATLGTEPQVVTAALDLLVRQGEDIRQVIVLHTYAPNTPIAEAVERLDQAFAPRDGRQYQKRMLANAHGDPLADVESPSAAREAFRTLYREVHQAKQAGLKVHLSIAGGRKSLSVFGMAAAQLLFDEQDRLWHLYSGGDFLASKRLHPLPGDDVHLISIPVILWSHISPVFTSLGQVDDPFEAARQVHDLQLNEKLEHCRSFILGSLSGAERRVVALLVQEGLSDQEIANRLVISDRTVENHLRSAYKKAGDHWGLAGVGRSGLIVLLNLYYSMNAPAEIRGKPA